MTIETATPAIQTAPAYGLPGHLSGALFLAKGGKARTFASRRDASLAAVRAGLSGGARYEIIQTGRSFLIRVLA